MMQPVLQTHGLCRSFGSVRAVADVDFALNAGEIHCLFGENGAGKSTLAACLFGALVPDAGQIMVRGREMRFRNPRDAIACGIGMVQQHFVLVPEFTVLENIVVGTHDRGWRLDLTQARRRLATLCTDSGITLDPDTLVRDLAVGQQQWVEILKALYLQASVLILDEPTAVLTPPEAERLFTVLRRMCAAGLSVILISHKMAEVMQADRVTILRRGSVVATLDPATTTPAAITAQMVGREVDLRVRRARATGVAMPPPVLEVQEVSLRGQASKPQLDRVSLTLGRGEILGLAGVSGNGQKPLFDLLSGVRAPDAGRIILNGVPMARQPARGFMDRGVGLVPDDRFRDGLIPEFDVQENLILGWQRDPAFRRGLFLDRDRIAARADAQIAEFQIATPSRATATHRLSGGNAQKVILAREFQHGTAVILANQPTRGLDLGVVEYVYRQLILRRDAGVAVLLASEDLEDLFNLADRIAVMSEGRIVGIVDPATTSLAEVGLMMAGRTGAAA